MEVDEPEFVNGPIALSQVQQQAVWLLAYQHLHKAQRIAGHRPWQMGQSSMLPPDRANHPMPESKIRAAHHAKPADVMPAAGIRHDFPHAF